MCKSGSVGLICKWWDLSRDSCAKRARHIKGWVDFWILQGVMCKSTADGAVQLRWRRVAHPYWLGVLKRR
jgi:hypothetical protein